jgi:hypothetical protein
VIVGLEWDDENEDRLAPHGLDAVLVTELVESGRWVLVRNTRTGSRRRRLIGYGPDGRWWTVVPEPSRRPGIWRPVTGWPSSPREIALSDERRRQGRG